MIMHKMTDELERGRPDPAVIEAVGNLVQESLKDAAFVSGEGLKPSSERVHIRYSGGKGTVTRGPFANPSELVGGFGLLRVRSEAEAISWLDKFGALLRDVELYMGPVVEPWDLGMVPKPKNPPLRFLSLHSVKENAGTEPATDPALFEKLAALIDEMTQAGVLQATGALESTKHGARVHFEGKRHTVLDGPFAESKELVAGYAILDLPSKEEAVKWAIRFGEIVKVHEVEIRQMPES
jgi:hypothetical protein